MLPLTSRLATHVPGFFAGDNLSCLWNTWWFRRSFAAHSLGLWCNLLFAPWGTSLLFHTHTLLEVAIGVVLFPGSTPTVAHNLTLIGGIVANGVCTYALAFHYTRRTAPSLIAGLMFAWSAFVTLHLAGHFNLVHAWVLPLLALSAARFLERPSNGRAVTLAACLASVAYSDYYYLVYSLLLGGLLAGARWFTMCFERRSAPARRRVLGLLAVAAVLVALVVVVGWTGGWIVTIGGRVVSMRGTRNLVTMATVVLAAAGLTGWRVRLEQKPGPVTTIGFRKWALGAGVLAVLLSPLIVAALKVVLAGGYASQPVLWRSSPPGIDLATLVEGPPRHLLFGDVVRVLYQAADIGPVEQCGWLGLVAMYGVGMALLRFRREPDVKAWLIVALVFFAIALGPFVRVGGVDTGIPAPFALWRYVPILANARIPGRAMIVVQLAAAVLTAMVLARRSPTWRGCVTWLMLLIAEAVPRPSPLYALPQTDAVDAALLAAPGPGTVLTLPAGIRDGFGVSGGVDHRELVHQMAHGRPMVGGFVARISPTLRAEYVRTPLFVTAFGLSDFERPIDRPIAAADASALGITFLVVNRDALNELSALTRSSLEASGFRYLMADGDRELYAVERAR
jgi:hypothetical protein